MLGRFRMSVPECIREYKTLGEKVFGNPRHLSPLRFVVGKWPKFNAATMREVFEDVTARRSELVNKTEFQPKMTFPFKRGVCRTLVQLSSNATGYFLLSGLIIQNK